MKHIGFWHPKGGVGKTTLSINVSAALVRAGFSVLLVDLDPQRSAKWIAGLSNGFPFQVEAGWPASMPKVDIVVSDHPPRLENIPPGGIIAAPVRPVAHEVAALMAAYRSLDGSKEHLFRPVLNFYDTRRVDHRDNSDSLEQLATAPRIGNRAIFERAINRGLTVFDKQLDRMSGAGQARAEIELLAEYLNNQDEN
jgi:chromosome partitioning protein